MIYKLFVGSYGAEKLEWGWKLEVALELEPSNQARRGLFEGSWGVFQAY